MRRANRRRVLRVLGAGGAVGTAGCGALGSEETDCDRTADETSLEAALRLVDEDGVGPEDVSVRGTIATMTADTAYVYDETGVGRLSTGLNRDFNTDELSPGDCIAASGGLDKPGSWSAQMPVISVNELERVGRTEETERLERIASAAPPDVLFDVDFGSASDECATRVTLTHAGDEPVRADELSVIYGREREYPRNPTLEDTTERPWTELGGTGTVTENDAVSVTVESRTSGAVLWRSGTGRNSERKGWGVSRKPNC